MRERGFGRRVTQDELLKKGWRKEGVWEEVEGRGNRGWEKKK